MPISTILAAAVSTTRPPRWTERAAGLDLEADARLRAGAAPARLPGTQVLIGGAAIDPATSACGSFTRTAPSTTTPTSPASSTARSTFEGLAEVDQLVNAEAREGLISKTRAAARGASASSLQPSPTTRRRSPTPRSAAAPRRTIRSPSPRSGARASASRSTWTRSTAALDTHVLFKLGLGPARRQGRRLDAAAA